MRTVLKHWLQNSGSGGASESYDSDYQLVLDKATEIGATQPNSTYKERDSFAMEQLKSFGLKDRLDALWFFWTGGTDKLFTYINWIDPDNHQITEGSATVMSFTEEDGIYSDGAAAYAKTNFTPSTDGVNFKQNDASVLMDILTDATEGADDFGTQVSHRFRLLSRQAATNARSSSNSNSTDNTTISGDAIGFHHLRRTASNAWSYLKDFVGLGSGSGSSTGVPAGQFHIAATNQGVDPVAFTTKHYAMLAIGDNMVDKAAQLYWVNQNRKLGTKFGGRIELTDTTSKRFNGEILYNSGENVFLGTIEGDLYVGTRDALSYSLTLLASSLGEISTVKTFAYSGTRYVVTGHKATGLIKLHACNADVPTGVTTTTIKTGYVEVQDIKMNDFDGSGAPQFSVTWQGNIDGDGGLSLMKYNGGDITNSTGWTVKSVVQANGAWWHTDPFTHGGNTYIGLTCRTNANPVPAGQVIVMTKPADPYADSWAETQIDATDLDFMHIRVGDFKGNGNNDLIAINTDNGNAYIYDVANSWTKETVTIFTGKTSRNVYGVGDLFGTGKDAFIQVFDTYFALLISWSGSAWVRKMILFETSNHAPDSDFQTLVIGGVTYYLFGTNANSPTYGEFEAIRIF